MRLPLYVLLFCLISPAYGGLFSAKGIKVETYATKAQMKKEAGKNPSVKWKLPMGQKVIAQAAFVDPGSLLVSLQNYRKKLKLDEFRLIDLNQGNLLWSYELDRKTQDAAFVISGSKALIIRKNRGKSEQVLGLLKHSGKPAWQMELKPNGYKIQQLDNQRFLIIKKLATGMEFTAHNMATGKSLWTFTEDQQKDFPQVLLRGKDLYIAGSGCQRRRSADGKQIWRKPNIQYHGKGRSVLGRGKWYIPQKHGLLAVKTENGAIVWHSKLPSLDLTSISLQGDQAYVLGLDGKKQNQMTVLQEKTGKIRWRHILEDSLPLSSNIVVSGTTVYVASPRSLFSLNNTSGALRYKKLVVKGQRSLYPVILRSLGDNIIFVGEQNIAAFDRRSGEKKYRKGITGISPRADLSAMESSIQRLQKELAKPVKVKTSNIFQQQATNFQTSADRHYQAYERAKWSGDAYGAEKEFLSSRIDSSFSRMASSLALWEAANNLSQAYYQHLLRSLDADDLRRHKLIRNSILSNYPAMITRNYVFRPNRAYDLVNGGEFLQITAIRLKDGKRRATSMSVPYEDYGLWLYVDESRGMAYQQSIGLDYKGEQPPVSYLIAKPIMLPK